MKKYLIVVMAFVTSYAFVSCHDDELGGSIIEQKKQTFEAAFIKAFGQPISTLAPCIYVIIQPNSSLQCAQWLDHVQLIITLMDCSLPGSSAHLWDYPGKNTRVA